MLLVILMEKKSLEYLLKMNYKKQIKKEFRVEKVIKRKSDMLNGKTILILLAVGLITRYCYIKMSYFSP